MADAARWEKWESQLRLGTDLSQVLREYDPSSFTVRLDEAQRRSAGSFGSQPPTVTNGKHAFFNTVGWRSASYASFTMRLSHCICVVSYILYLLTKLASCSWRILTSHRRYTYASTASARFPTWVPGPLPGSKPAIPASAQTSERST